MSAAFGFSNVTIRGAYLNIDKELASKLSRNPKYSDSEKHIMIKFYHLRNNNLNGQISTIYVQSKANFTDISNKVLLCEFFEDVLRSARKYKTSPVDSR